MAAAETKEEYIAGLLARNPHATVTGDVLIPYPGAPSRRIVPCTADCDYAACTGWTSEYADDPD